MSKQSEALRLADALRDGTYLLSQERNATEAELRRLNAENERLRAELAEWHKLRDPVSLHVNLLRGVPARLDAALYLHLGGHDQLMDAERKAAWNAVNAFIKPGDLGGNGCDQNAQRNGLILAANLLKQRLEGHSVGIEPPRSGRLE